MNTTTAPTTVIADLEAIRQKRRLFRSLDGWFCSVPLWWMICLALAGILTWDSRHYVNPDGLSYLDLASKAVSGGPAKLLNGCWSPGYPALISIGLWIFHPAATQEFVLIHLINFAIFAVTLWAFSSFLKEWLASRGHVESAGDFERWLIPFAFCTFLWFTLHFSAVGLITPDLCVAAVVFCAASICCRLSFPEAATKHYAALGLVLTVGYYLKSAMLPLGFLLLGLLTLTLSRGRSRQKLFISFMVFVVMSAPLVVMMSERAGQLSYGDAGRLNYLWDVNQIPDIGWVGDVRGTYGTPAHPPRTLVQAPRTIEFASGIGDTYPLWDDPSYWYGGVIPRPNLRQQLAAIKKSLRSYGAILSQINVLASGALVLLLWCLRKKALPVLPRSTWWQLAWPLGACSMYALVHVDHRYISPFLVLFFVSVYGGLTLRLKHQGTWPILAICVVTLMLTFSADLIAAGLHAMRELVGKRQPVVYETVSDHLRGLGLRSGDRLALVGSAFSRHESYPYYARTDRLRVVAQVMDEEGFWRLSGPDLASVENNLAAAGVKAVIAINRPGYLPKDGWNDIDVGDGTRFNILLLPGRNPSSP